MQDFADQPLSVFAVWQPMLVTDWSPPIGWVLRRMPDRRVRQYWDPGHLVAKKLRADARRPQPEPDCCDQSGILWDLVAVYSADAMWTDRLPIATMLNGPIAQTSSDLTMTIGQLLRQLPLEQRLPVEQHR